MRDEIAVGAALMRARLPLGDWADKSMKLRPGSPPASRLAPVAGPRCGGWAGGSDHRPANWVAATVAFDNPFGVALLLDKLREAGAAEQAVELADRAAAGVALDSPRGVAGLLNSLREAAAAGQVIKLTERLPAAGLFSIHPESRSPRYRFGRQSDGRPTSVWVGLTWTERSCAWLVQGRQGLASRPML
jgi:hypothetical protein